MKMTAKTGCFSEIGASKVFLVSEQPFSRHQKTSSLTGWFVVPIMLCSNSLSLIDSVIQLTLSTSPPRYYFHAICSFFREKCSVQMTKQTFEPHAKPLEFHCRLNIHSKMCSFCCYIGFGVWAGSKLGCIDYWNPSSIHFFIILTCNSVGVCFSPHEKIISVCL